MRALTLTLAVLFLSHTASAQKTISFPTEDGGVVFADLRVRRPGCRPGPWGPVQQRELGEAGSDPAGDGI